MVSVRYALELLETKGNAPRAEHFGTQGPFNTRQEPSLALSAHCVFQVDEGQRVNITLLDFGLDAVPEERDAGAAAGPLGDAVTGCRVYATIKEQVRVTVIHLHFLSRAPGPIPEYSLH